MTGLPNYNYDAFDREESKLRQMGYQGILNPTTINDGGSRKTYNFYMMESLMLLLKAKSVVLLEGWEKSNGATIEYICAVNLGIPLYSHKDYKKINPNLPKLCYSDITKNDGPSTDDEDPFKDNTDNKSILEIANDIVGGTRQKNYGHPKDHFADVGKVWGTLLGLDSPIPPSMVGMMMIGLKLCREKNVHKIDNIIDMAGYAKTISMIEDYEK